MKSFIYFTFGILLGSCVAVSYVFYHMPRPYCFEDQYLVKDIINDYVCINIDDIPDYSKTEPR